MISPGFASPNRSCSWLDRRTADDRARRARCAAGLQQMAVRAHSRGIKLIGATLTPFGNETFMADAWNPTREKHRVTVNKWIRESGAFDGVADFDAALRDPE